MKYALCVLSIAAVVLTCFISAKAASSEPGLYFVIRYSPGTAWKAEESIFEQDLLDHGQYMQSLFDQGILLTGGPFTDGSGGLAIIEVGSERQAREILESDPAITAAVFEGTIAPYFPVFLRKNDKARSLST